jgi:chromosome segregation ATPase
MRPQRAYRIRSVPRSASPHLVLELVRKAELLQELGKWKLSVHMREEKLSENSVRIEQQHRVLEGSSTVAVEIQVLRDRIHSAEYLEVELGKVKEKNVELGRKVRQLERALTLAQEEKEFGRVEADLRPIGENGMTEGEEVVMKLKDEIADLRNANSRLQKEQQHRDIAAKHAEQRLKMCLQDNLALHQKLNRVEEELNSTKTEISDLLGQIEHQRDVEEERLQVSGRFRSLLIFAGCKETPYHRDVCDGIASEFVRVSSRGSSSREIERGIEPM